MSPDLPLGVTPRPGGDSRALVWAPRLKRLELERVADGRRQQLQPAGDGYFKLEHCELQPGDDYWLLLDGARRRPDPASRLQPQGVHGPSRVVDPGYGWSDQAWSGVELERLVVYELHVGCFSESGSFEGVLPQLERLVELGVTAIELMPVAQFPGERNWGYDGVQPFAVQASYGGPEGLRRLVDACHGHGLAVILDVVYNHLGPEGNYLAEYGPYFSGERRTPWGPAINFDGPESDHVRRYFVENALRWVEDFHLDGLRLDAVHAILDHSPLPFLEQLSVAVDECARALGRRVWLIAESDANDGRLISEREHGGLGIDAVWADDLHHALHAALTGERDGYYVDYPDLGQLAAALEHGFAYRGQYSRYRRRSHGRPHPPPHGERYLVCSQNHDQVGNRMLGERMGALVDFASLRLAAAVVLLSAATPLLYMGEEYGETAPFLYFVSHGDEQLLEAVREGRRQEFSAFAWRGEPPDPTLVETFERSRLQPALREQPHARQLEALYRELLRLRREHPALLERGLGTIQSRVIEGAEVVEMRRAGAGQTLVCLFNFAGQPHTLTRPHPSRWSLVLSTEEARFGGEDSATAGELDPDARGRITLAARSAAVYAQQEVQT